MKIRSHYQESRPRSGARWTDHINKPCNEPARPTSETRRLILRPFESGDAEAAFAWFGDAIVMRFTPTGPDISVEQTKARVDYASWRNPMDIMAALKQEEKVPETDG